MNSRLAFYGIAGLALLAAGAAFALLYTALKLLPPL